MTYIKPSFSYYRYIPFTYDHGDHEDVVLAPNMSSRLPSSHVCALYGYYKDCGLVDVIDINTHDLFFCLYKYAFRNTTG